MYSQERLDLAAALSLLPSDASLVTNNQRRFVFVFCVLCFYLVIGPSSFRLQGAVHREHKSGHDGHGPQRLPQQHDAQGMEHEHNLKLSTVVSLAYRSLALRGLVVRRCTRMLDMTDKILEAS